MLNAHADALIDLAEVLALAGQDARAELEQAHALYERKGNLVMAHAIETGGAHGVGVSRGGAGSLKPPRSGSLADLRRRNSAAP
jgi:hypothetical protein